jgi:DnaA family protein
MNSLVTDPQSQQLTLNMRPASEQQWQDFDFSAAPEVEQQLLAFTKQPEDRVILLQGVSGCGKSHLLQASAQLAMQNDLQVGMLAAQELLAMGDEIDPLVLDGFEQFDLVCVDDIDLLSKIPAWSEALFHLYNACQQLDHALLFTSTDTPRNLDCSLADLRSRLQMALLLPVEPLDEVGQAKQLLARAHNLGLVLTEDVANYICLHSQRNLHDIMAVLAKLDAASWQAKRRLTIPFVKQIMQW